MPINPTSPPTAAEALARSIHTTRRAAGFTAYFAGGCVRDLLLQRAPKDYDLATDATPAQVEALFPRTVATGKAFGVIQVIGGPGLACEVATFRREGPYRDGRRPEAVAFCAAEEDARRRDFTVNGLFYDPERAAVIDYVGGRADLERRLVRAIGEPEARFREDHLRMLRAVRFAATLGFALEPATAAAIRALAPLCAGVSAERIQQELSRLLLEAPRAGDGLRQLHELGLLVVLLPEVERMVGQQQPPEFHPEGDVFVHTCGMLNALPPPPRDLTLVYAVLLHDVGKPPTAQTTREPDGRERIRFERHADVGAALARAILERLKLPTREIDAISHCVGNHMRFADVPHMRRAKLRALVGAPTFPVELELHRLDCVSSHGKLEPYLFLQRFIEELRQEPVLPAPWITGRDLLAAGVPEGRELGRWKQLAYEAQLENRFADRAALLAWLQGELRPRPR